MMEVEMLDLLGIGFGPAGIALERRSFAGGRLAHISTRAIWGLGWPLRGCALDIESRLNSPKCCLQDAGKALTECYSLLRSGGPLGCTGGSIECAADSEPTVLSAACATGAKQTWLLRLILRLAP